MLATSKANGWARFVTMQNHYNLLYREEEREMKPLCQAEGIGLIPYSPLARGVLTGNRKAETTRAKTDAVGTQFYGKEIADADQRVIDNLADLAKKRGVPSAQLALAWLLHKPAMTAPIVGASKPHHLDDALADDVGLGECELLEDGEQQLLLAHRAGVLDPILLRERDELGRRLGLEVFEFNFPHWGGPVG